MAWARPVYVSGWGRGRVQAACYCHGPAPGAAAPSGSPPASAGRPLRVLSTAGDWFVEGTGRRPLGVCAAHAIGAWHGNYRVVGLGGQVVA